jgi:hypothetical protein
MRSYLQERARNHQESEPRDHNNIPEAETGLTMLENVRMVETCSWKKRVKRILPVSTMSESLRKRIQSFTG